MQRYDISVDCGDGLCPVLDLDRTVVDVVPVMLDLFGRVDCLALAMMGILVHHNNNGPEVRLNNSGDGGNGQPLMVWLFILLTYACHCGR